MRAFLPLALALVGPWLPSLPAQVVEFTDGQLADLRLEITHVSAPFAGSVLLGIDVRNLGKATAEPTVFACTTGIAGELHRIERCPLPHAGRYGRGVAPAHRRTYWLQLETAAAPKSVKVEVASATFHRAQPMEEPPVLVGPLRQQQVARAGLQVAATVAEFKSIVPEPLDLIVRATFREPEVCKALYAVRLDPAEVREVVFSRRPNRLGYGDQPGVDGVRIEQLEVLDWTVVKAAPPADAAGGADTQPLLQAYDRWVRWPTPWPSGDGRFVATYLRSDRADGRADVITGAFTLKDITPPILTHDGNLDLQAREAVEAAVDAAFADLRRMDLAELQQRHRLSVADRQRYLLEGPGWDGLFGRLVDVANGTITRVAPPDRATASWQTWQVQPEGAGYLVTGRETFEVESGKTPLMVERRSYARMGRWLVPLRYGKETRRQAFRELVEVTFRCGPLKQRGEVPPGPPQGLGVEALRQAWQNGYAYAKEAVSLRARLQVTSPASDPIWQGEKRVLADLELTGFSGLRQDGTGWRECVSRIDMKSVPVDVQGRLAAAIEDRLLLLAWRDFAGRSPFQEVFAGARVLPADGRPGVFTVANHEFDEVEVKDGLVVRLRQAGGQDRRIDWQKQEGMQLPVRISQGDSRVAFAWKRIEGTWFLPIDVKLEGLFGRTWGPETLKLGDVKLAR